MSKGGYLNLLLANKKKTASPGDNKPMITAREAFLSTGAYDFLTENIATSVPIPPPLSKDSSRYQVLDIGCGSGYYTRSLYPGAQVAKTGIDISKIAIAKAAALDKASTYVVGSAFDLPVADASVDLLLNIFAPLDLSELKRVLRAGRHFVKVIPTGDHMREVAELVYDQVKPHTSDIVQDMESTPELSILKINQLKKTLTLANEDLHNFIAMTPYVYKFAEGQMEELKELTVTLSFEVIVGIKN